MAEVLKLSDLTVEVDDFITQFNNDLRNKGTWKGQLTTQTSQTIIEYISTVGALDSAKIIRSSEDAFAETALADDAIRSITTMQGLRMTRKLPAQITVSLTSTMSLTLSPYTQMTIGGIKFFNREQVEMTAGQPINVELAQGSVISFMISGLGSDYQTFISPEDGFNVSDIDTQVRINGTLINKSFGILWNYKGQPAFADLTLPDGRLNVQFGNSRFGSVPQTNDIVAVTYVVTNGSDSNGAATQGKRVNIDGFPQITGTATTSPSGGSGVKNVVVYKNVASGSFGTYQSAVTRSQYIAQVNTYPGIVDAVTQAQREIDPMDLQYMNVIRVSALTDSPWTQGQRQDFIDQMQRVTMYSTRFIWFDAIPLDRDIDVDVYAFNTATLSQVQALSEQAVTNLLAPQPGILMTDYFNSDIITAIKKANRGQVSYVIVNAPLAPMTVNAPSAANVTYEIIPGTGSLGPLVYSYSVAVTNAQDEGPPNFWINPQITGVATDNSIKLTWNEIPGAVSYRIYGRQGGALGLIATIPATLNGPPVQFTDNGSITPTGGLPNTLSLAPIRYNRLRNLTVRVHFAERQRKLDGNPERLDNA